MRRSHHILNIKGAHSTPHPVSSTFHATVYFTLGGGCNLCRPGKAWVIFLVRYVLVFFIHSLYIYLYYFCELFKCAA